MMARKAKKPKPKRSTAKRKPDTLPMWVSLSQQLLELSELVHDLETRVQRLENAGSGGEPNVEAGAHPGEAGEGADASSEQVS